MFILENLAITTTLCAVLNTESLLNLVTFENFGKLAVCFVMLHSSLKLEIKMLFPTLLNQNAVSSTFLMEILRKKSRLVLGISNSR